MRYLTMVKRAGNPKANANDMTYTLIGDDMSVHVISGAKLAKDLLDKKINVVNMAVSSKGLVSTNGALNKYTTIDENNMVYGTPRAVILSRIEVNGELKFYVVFSPNGTVARVGAIEAGKMAEAGLIANGKPRNTEKGTVVAAIGGTYPLYDANIKEKPAKPTVDLVFIGSAVLGDASSRIEYAGAIIGSKSAVVSSKIHSKIEAENKKLIDTIAKKFPGMESGKLDGFSIRQVNGASFYGVFPLSVVTQLIQEAEGYKAPKSGVMVACTDYNDNCVESMVLINKDGSIQKAQTGSELCDNSLKNYAKKVSTYLKKFN